MEKEKTDLFDPDNNAPTIRLDLDDGISTASSAVTGGIETFSSWMSGLFPDDTDEIFPGNDSSVPAEHIDCETENCLREVGEAFEIRETIAVGGQGSIHRARDIAFGRTVAVKTLHQKHIGNLSFRQAFLNEARISALLEHPAIIPVYGLFRDNGNGLHLAMKMVDGITLRQYFSAIINKYRSMRRRRIGVCENRMLPQRLEMFNRICDAIAYSHHRGIIHRDLKPENVMLGKFNALYVMDWGIAEVLSQGSSTAHPLRAGTLQYIAPEVIGKCGYDKRSDVYSLGLILYETVFLHSAYPNAVPQKQLLSLVKSGRFAVCRHKFGCRVDAVLCAVIRKALAFDPEDRYKDVMSLRADVEAYLHSEPVSISRRPRIDRILLSAKRHYRGVITVCLMLCSVIALLAGCWIWQRWQAADRLRIRNDLLAGMQGKVIRSIDKWTALLQNFANDMDKLSGEAAMRITDDREQNTSRDVSCLKSPGSVSESDLWLLSSKPPEQDMPVLRHPVSLNYFLNTSQDGGTAAPGRLERLSIMLPEFRRSLEASLHGIGKRGGVLSCGYFISLSSEEQLLHYPYLTECPDVVSRLAGAAVRNAMHTPDRVYWGRIVLSGTGDGLLPCFRLLRGYNGEILGAVCGYVVFSDFDAVLNEIGGHDNYVLSRMLLDDTGRMLALSSKGGSGDDEKRKSLMYGSEKSAPPSLIQESFSEMCRRGSGVLSEGGRRNTAYIYRSIDLLHWMYVEEIDLTALDRD